MPSCVVKCCKNRFKKTKQINSPKITFHMFPTNERAREDWTLIIRKSRGDDNWTPSRHSTVCSVHFDEQDYFLTPKGLRRLYPFVIPKNLLTSPGTQTQNIFATVMENSHSSDEDMEENPLEEQDEPDPATWLDIKEEVLWGDEQNFKKPEASQEKIPTQEVELPPPSQSEQSSVILQELRREIASLARQDEVSSSLDQIRCEIKELSRGDEFDAFGRYVASLLRNMRPRRAHHVQPLIINLLTAEMIKQDDYDLQ